MPGRACAPAGAGDGWMERRTRAPWAPSPPPPLCCARADTSCGGGVRGARPPLVEPQVSRPAAALKSRLTGARAPREHAASNPGPGAEKEKRASSLGARAPPKGCSCLRVILPRQAGLSREQVAGMPAPGRGGGGGDARASASGSGRLGLGACTARPGPDTAEATALFPE